MKKKLPPVSVQAMRLLGAWNRIAQGHVALSTGCSCGVGVSNLRVQDFEQDILAFLRGRHGGAFAGTTLPELLGGIARNNDAGARALLADLQNSISSFEEQHSGR